MENHHQVLENHLDVLYEPCSIITIGRDIRRAKLENQLQTLDALERSRAENAELRGRLQRLDAQYNAFVSGERELVELNDRLERDLGELRAESDRARETAQRDREQAEQLVAGSRAAWTEEKCHMQSRVDDLDVQLASALKKLSTATTDYKQVFFLLCIIRV